MYESVKWISKYNIGIDSVDEQHRSLFELANKFFSLNEDDSKDEFKKLIYEFNNYLAVHFKDEEEFMESIGYPDLENHKKLHSNIIERGLDVLKTSATIPVMKAKMKKVSKDFFINHILKEDIKIKYFYDEPVERGLEDITDAAFR